MKKIIKKMKPWKAPDVDKIYPFYCQKIDATHKKLHNAITKNLKDEMCNEWETIGRTILIEKKGKDLSKVENYRPITCLLIIYKIQSAIVANKLTAHMHTNELWPYEQMGTVPKTQGSKEVLALDSIIAKEARLYGRNLCMVWTDVKKAYDSIFQTYILRTLTMLKVSKWIINWISSAMKSWRTRIEMLVNGEQIVTDVIRIS